VVKKDSRNLAVKQAALDYFGQLRTEWRRSIWAFVLPGIGNVLVFYAPALVIRALLERFSAQGSLSAHDLLPYVLVFIGVWSIGELFWRVTIQIMIGIEVRSIERLYLNAMREMLRRDLSFFHNNFAGSLTKKTISYAKNFELFFDTMVFSVISHIIPLIFISVILWLYSPWLVAGLLGMLTLAVACVYPLILRRQKLVIVRETANNVVGGHIADIYSNVDAVRAFANETYESKLHRKYVRDAIEKTRRSWDYQNKHVYALTSPLYVLTNAVGLVLALSLGRDGQSAAAIFVTFSYFATFTRIMWDFNQIYRQLESALSEAGQFAELLFEQPGVTDPPSPQAFKPTGGEINLHDVSFRYHDSNQDLLFEHLNLRIKSGERVGLVGHSGGGKTTITKLLLRFMDIKEGEILIDDQNIAKVSQADLRAAIAYVPQDPVMFHRSLADNIRYGKLDATDREVRQAATRAHALEFIEQLPDGFETLVGERGIKLSGGQRQRIAIARAMIRNAPILLLDEATSALDSESERFIQDALWQLMKGRTAIVIAHRLSTIQRMDRIIVMDKGAIVEEGTHKELLANGGIYAKLWAHQSGGFLEND
jgi:ATP-binding cassette subfamily B protein